MNKWFKMVVLKFFLNVVFVFLSFQSLAVSYRTPYLHFDIPKNWNCKAFNVTYVCHSKEVQTKGLEYFIIVTAKEVGAIDTLEDYSQHLKQQKIPKKTKQSQKNPPLSKVIHVKKRNIHSHSWIDGFHRGGEYSDYYARYLATTNDDKKLAILVTYSVHEKRWKKHSSEIIKSIRSLKLLAAEGVLRKIRSGNPAIENARVAQYISGLFGEGEYDFENEEESSGIWGSIANHPFETIAGVLGSVAFLYVLIRRLRKKKKNKTPKSGRSPIFRRKRK